MIKSITIKQYQKSQGGQGFFTITMPVSISIWRAQIGTFLGQKVLDHRNKAKYTDIFRHYLIITLFLVYVFDLLINLDKDICTISKRIFGKTLFVLLKTMIECKIEILFLGYILSVLKLTLILLSNDVEQ